MSTSYFVVGIDQATKRGTECLFQGLQQIFNFLIDFVIGNMLCSAKNQYSFY